MKLLNLSKKNFAGLKLKNFYDEINNFFMNSYYSKIRNYVKLIRKSLNEMEELKNFQSSTFDTIAGRRLVEDQDTILELTCKIQELVRKINSSPEIFLVLKVSSFFFLRRRGREGRREERGGGREPTAVHLPCARSHSNASKLAAVLVDRFFPQCFVARREERRGRGRGRGREESI